MSPHTGPCPLAAPRAPAPAGPRSLAGGRVTAEIRSAPSVRASARPALPPLPRAARGRRYFLLKGPPPPAGPARGRDSPGQGRGTAGLLGRTVRVFSILFEFLLLCVLLFYFNILFYLSDFLLFYFIFFYSLSFSIFFLLYFALFILI